MEETSAGPLTCLRAVKGSGCTFGVQSDGIDVDFGESLTTGYYVLNAAWNTPDGSDERQASWAWRT